MSLAPVGFSNPESKESWMRKKQMEGKHGAFDTTEATK